MAARKTTKSNEVINNEEPKSTTQVTVDADALINSILNKVDNKDKSHDKKFIMCRSVTIGGLNVNCKSGNVYEFKEYGADCEIEYHDLCALIRKHSDHIFKPRFIIEDDDVLAEFPQVAKEYNNIYSLDDINEVFELSPSHMIETIKSMPKNVQNNLQTLISTKIANGSIDSVRTIRALSEYFDSDFNLLSELFAR